jgi:hypothetical protein
MGNDFKSRSFCDNRQKKLGLENRQSYSKRLDDALLTFCIPKPYTNKLTVCAFENICFNRNKNFTTFCVYSIDGEENFGMWLSKML